MNNNYEKMINKLLMQYHFNEEVKAIIIDKTFEITKQLLEEDETLDFDKVLSEQLEKLISIQITKSNKEFSSYAGKQIRKGIDNSIDFYYDLDQNKLLTKEEETELGYRILKGDQEAVEILVQKNMRLAQKFAKKYLGNGLSYDDLIQEGYTGLITAAKKFDVRKGCRFSTYAVPWINESIMKAIRCNSRNIRIPSGLFDKLVRYINTSKALEIELFREPTEEEIACKMNISLEEVKKYKKIQNDTISLDNLYYENDDRNKIEYHIGIDQDETINKIIDNNLKEDVWKLVLNSNLSQREIMVLTYRFGMYDGNIWKYEDIAELFNITRQRVSQIVGKALYKIRKNAYTDACAVYTEDEKKSLENLQKLRCLYLEKPNSKRKSLI